MSNSNRTIGAALLTALLPIASELAAAPASERTESTLTTGDGTACVVAFV